MYDLNDIITSQMVTVVDHGCGITKFYYLYMNK